jgi:hypothetical protein
MAKTKKERMVSAYLAKMRDANNRASEAYNKGEAENYSYWKGVAHGIARGWDLAQGMCQA